MTFPADEVVLIITLIILIIICLPLLYPWMLVFYLTCKGTIPESEYDELEQILVELGIDHLLELEFEQENAENPQPLQTILRSG